MSIRVQEGNLAFVFPDGWRVTRFDAWSFYRGQFENVCGGAKAVDFLAIDQEKCLWLIEVKDYRNNPRSKDIGIAEEMAAKVRDSLAALVAAKVRANDADEKEMATAALRCSELRIRLHLEQPAQHSKLFPRAYNPASVAQRMKQLLKAIDPHPGVLESTCMRNSPWTVETNPSPSLDSVS